MLIKLTNLYHMFITMMIYYIKAFVNFYVTVHIGMKNFVISTTLGEIIGNVLNLIYRDEPLIMQSQIFVHRVGLITSVPNQIQCLTCLLKHNYYY